MKKTFLAVAIVAVSLVVVLCLSIDGGNCQERQPSARREKVAMDYSPKALWADGPKYAIPLNDPNRELLNNDWSGSPRMARRVPERYGRINVTDPVVFLNNDAPTTAASHRDKYGLDPESINNPYLSSKMSKKDDWLHYDIQWDDSKEWFVYRNAHWTANWNLLLSLTPFEVLGQAHDCEMFY